MFSLKKSTSKTAVDFLQAALQKGLTLFIEFMFSIIRDELINISKLTPKKSVTNNDRIEIAKTIFGNNFFTRKEYLQKFKEISEPTASRDLKNAVEKKMIIKFGDKRLTKYRFK